MLFGLLEEFYFTNSDLSFLLLLPVLSFVMSKLTNTLPLSDFFRNLSLVIGKFYGLLVIVCLTCACENFV